MAGLNPHEAVAEALTHDSSQLFQMARNSLVLEVQLLQKRIAILEKACGVSKICPGCAQPEGTVSFGRNYARPDGRQVYCRMCRKAKSVSRKRDSPALSAGDGNASKANEAEA